MLVAHIYFEKKKYITFDVYYTQQGYISFQGVMIPCPLFRVKKIYQRIDQVISGYINLFLRYEYTVDQPFLSCASVNFSSSQLRLLPVTMLSSGLEL